LTSATVDEVDGVADRAREDEASAEHDVRSGGADLMPEHERDAGVADRERDDLARTDPAAEQQHAEREDERRFRYQDQPLEAGGDELQSGEVEKACQ
jgi:hypothetical protein